MDAPSLIISQTREEVTKRIDLKNLRVHGVSIESQVDPDCREIKKSCCLPTNIHGISPNAVRDPTSATLRVSSVTSQVQIGERQWAGAKHTGGYLAVNHNDSQIQFITVDASFRDCLLDGGDFVDEKPKDRLEFFRMNAMNIIRIVKLPADSS